MKLIFLCFISIRSTHTHSHVFSNLCDKICNLKPRTITLEWYYWLKNRSDFFIFYVAAKHTNCTHSTLHSIAIIFVSALKCTLSHFVRFVRLFVHSLRSLRHNWLVFHSRCSPLIFHLIMCCCCYAGAALLLRGCQSVSLIRQFF